MEKTVKLHIWTPTRPKFGADAPENSRQPSKDVIVRICIEDVLYAYVRLEVADIVDCHLHAEDVPMDEDIREGRLVVQSVTAFGPRERVRCLIESTCILCSNSSLEITTLSVRLHGVSETVSTRRLDDPGGA